MGYTLRRRIEPIALDVNNSTTKKQKTKKGDEREREREREQ
jgi:hypothetical protein